MHMQLQSEEIYSKALGFVDVIELCSRTTITLMTFLGSAQLLQITFEFQGLGLAREWQPHFQSPKLFQIELEKSLFLCTCWRHFWHLFLKYLLAAKP